MHSVSPSTHPDPPDPRQHAPRPAPTPALRPRLVAGLVFAATLGLLLVSAWLSPSSSGTGTHTQLGLPPCGFKVATGLPCATCGMTTAFSHAAHGQLAAAFSVQPTGTLLALVTAMAAVVSGWALVAGMPLTPLGRALWRPATAIALGAAVLLGWLYTLLAAIGS